VNPENLLRCEMCHTEFQFSKLSQMSRRRLYTLLVLFLILHVVVFLATAELWGVFFVTHVKWLMEGFFITAKPSGKWEWLGDLYLGCAFNFLLIGVFSFLEVALRRCTDSDDETARGPSWRWILGCSAMRCPHCSTACSVWTCRLGCIMILCFDDIVNKLVFLLVYLFTTPSGLCLVGAVGGALFSGMFLILNVAYVLQRRYHLVRVGIAHSTRVQNFDERRRTTTEENDMANPLAG